MFETVSFSDVIELLYNLPPASYNSAQTSSRIKATKHTRFVVQGSTGLIASTGTFNLKIQQHNAASSGTTKDLATARALTALDDTGDNKAFLLEFLSSALDVKNGFYWFSVVATPATAASLLWFQILGVDPKHLPVSKALYQEVVTGYGT